MVGACRKNGREEKLYSKSRKGRLRMKWLDDVESDLKKMKVKG
jgi:hypothetical protein